MRKLFSFFSRRKKDQKDPIRPRTMAESEAEDLKDTKSETPERKRFDEKSFERAKDDLPLRDSSATH